MVGVLQKTRCESGKTHSPDGRWMHQGEKILSFSCRRAWRRMVQPDNPKDGITGCLQTINEVIDNDGDVPKVLDVLGEDVCVPGIFSDWPATVTYRTNCRKGMGR